MLAGRRAGNLTPTRSAPFDRVDALFVEPRFDLDRVESHEFPDLAERDSALSDESTDEPFGDTKTVGESGNIEELKFLGPGACRGISGWVGPHRWWPLEGVGAAIMSRLPQKLFGSASSAPRSRWANRFLRCR